jgi:hypothetical protein
MFLEENELADIFESYLLHYNYIIINSMEKTWLNPTHKENMLNTLKVLNQF